MRADLFLILLYKSLCAGPNCSKTSLSVIIIEVYVLIISWLSGRSIYMRKKYFMLNIYSHSDLAPTRKGAVGASVICFANL